MLYVLKKEPNPPAAHRSQVLVLGGRGYINYFRDLGTVWLVLVLQIANAVGPVVALRLRLRPFRSALRWRKSQASVLVLARGPWDHQRIVWISNKKGRSAG